MKPNDGIRYKDVIDLGFKRQDEHDSVFFDDNGYDWFIVTKKVFKRMYLDWDCEEHTVTLYHEDKDHNVEPIETMCTIEEVRKILRIFGKLPDGKLPDQSIDVNYDGW